MPSWDTVFTFIHRYNRRFNATYKITTKWRAVYTFLATAAKQLATIAAAIETILKFRDTRTA